MISDTQRRVALLLLLLVYTSSFLDRSILSSLVEPIKQEFDLADSQLGFVSGFAFAIFYAVLGIPIARLADRHSRKAIIAISLVAWSGMTIATGFVQSFVQLAMARIGVAVGEAGGTPPAYSLIADYYPLERRATATAIYSLGVPLGILIGFIIGGFLAQAYGWRMAFFAVGAPGLILAVFVIWLVPEPPRTKSASGEESSQSLGTVIGLMWQQKSLRHLVVAATIANFVGQSQLAWLGSFFARTHNLDIATRSLILAFMIGIGGFIGNLAAGYLADRLGQRDVRWKLWILGVGTAFFLPFAAVGYLADNVTLSVVALVIPSIGGSFWLPPTFALVPSLVAVRMRATATALLLLVGTILGMGLGPWYVGVVSDLFRPSLGADALRYALMSTILFSAWAIFHFVRAASHLKADIAYASSLDRELGQEAPPSPATGTI